MRRARTRSAQRGLAELGFDVGAADGKMGRQTQQALREYQRKSGLPATGEINDPTLKKMFANWGTADGNAENDKACVSLALGQPPVTITPPPPPETATPKPPPPPETATPTPTPMPIVCPQGQRRVGNTCVPVCTGGQILVRGKCACASNQVFDRRLNRCRAQCRTDQRFDGKRCVNRCSSSQRFDGKRCVSRCSSSQRWDGKRCVSRCSSSQRWDGKRCVSRCSSSQRWDGKRCVSRCSSSQRWDGKRCVSRCSSSQRWDGKRCVSRCPSSQRWDARAKRCVNRCSGGKVPKNGKCVCPTGQFEVRGKCTAIRIQPPLTINPNLTVPR